LKTVRGTRTKVDQFITEHPIMRVFDPDDLLLSLVIGFTDSHLSRRFLVDHLTVATMRHEIEKRYATLFQWIHDFQMDALRNGYATADGRRKYIDGLRSSNIAKSKRAQEHVVRWLIRL
jgi:hypothetical protein